MNVQAAIVGLLLGVLTASCQDESVGIAERGYPAKSVPETELRFITSSVNDRTYEISVAFPRGYDEADSPYPVLYVLDANLHFGTVVETVRSSELRGDPEPLVIGVGYPVGRYRNSYGIRAVDLIPTSDQDYIERSNKEHPERLAMEGSGGGPDFLRFILEELIPLIEAEYRASPKGRGLFGWSYGGLFAAYALFEAKEAFDRFILVSPSLWWDDLVIFEMEREYAETHAFLAARIYLTVGALESDHMISELHEFSEALRAREYEGLSQRLYVAEGEDHFSVIPATIDRGLRYIYGGEED